MSIKKGEVYLANLGDVKCADIGKIRPVLIFQNNNLNRMITDGIYSDVIIIPLSSKMKINDFTLSIKKRDKLQKNSSLLCNAIKMVNSKRLMLDEGVLTVLTDQETIQVESILKQLFDFKHWCIEQSSYPRKVYVF